MRGIGLALFVAALFGRAVGGCAQEPAAAALKAFAAHCSRCHQEESWSIARSLPAASVTSSISSARPTPNIRQAIRARRRSIPASSTASMPKDMDYATIFGPSGEETKAISAWIESLAEAAEATIASRTFIEDEDVVRLIGDDLSRSSPTSNGRACAILR